MSLETRETGPHRGALIAEGKTKRIYEYPGDPSKAVVEYKNDITAFDDPSKTRQFESKARHSNTTNARVFEMLNRAGIPTAFVRQLSDTEFLAEKCEMVPLEVVARRYGFGSYLSRHPEFKTGEGEVPHRFDETLVEFFLKTTKGALTRAGQTLVEGLDPLKGQEDPFIVDPDADTWALAHPKKEAADPESSLGRALPRDAVASKEQVREMRELVRKAFATLEAFFESKGYHLVDFKIEFGITDDGRLVIADVIDNDSWRLRNAAWQDLSKQSFRDGEDLSVVEDKYAAVAALMDESKA